MGSSSFVKPKSKLKTRGTSSRNRIAVSELRSLPTPARKIVRSAIILLLVAATTWAAPERHSKNSSTIAATAKEAAQAKARERVLSASPLAMFYDSNDSWGQSSLQEHLGAITLLAPQCFVLDGEGALRGRIPGQDRDLAVPARVPIMPLVANRDFDRATAHILLHNASAQQRAINALAESADRDADVGWQLDFENLAPEDKLAYSRFVARLALRLHRDHRLLSVAVVSRFSDRFPDSSGPGFHTGEWGAAYDFHALARSADFLTLMAYDEHTSLTPPGPVAGYDFVKAALDYAVRRVPPSKLVLGLPLFGREWVQSPRGTTSRSLAYKDLKPYFDNPATVRYWDDLYRTSWFKWQDGDSVRTAWFDDARSLREKLKLVALYHLRGYAAWRLGVEDPEFWEKSEGED